MHFNNKIPTVFCTGGPVLRLAPSTQRLPGPHRPPELPCQRKCRRASALPPSHSIIRGWPTWCGRFVLHGIKVSFWLLGIWDPGGSAEGRWHRRGDAGAVEPSAYSRGTRARGFAPTPNFASSVFNVCVHNVFNMYSVCVCVCVCVCVRVCGVFFLHAVPKGHF